MHFQDYVSRESILRLGLLIGKTMPRSIGYGLAKAIGWGISAVKPQVYRIVYRNLKQVLGQDTDRSVLHRLTRRVFCHAGQCYYDFFQALKRPASEYHQVIQLPDAFVQRVRDAQNSGRGLLMIGPHMSNFNLVARALGSLGVPVQLLSLSNPTAGFEMWNHLLEHGDLRVTPISPQTLRQAVRNLREGGIVMTGADLPSASEESAVEFFGRGAYLPSGLARIAELAKVPVVVGACRFCGDGRYILETTEPLELEPTRGSAQLASNNTQRLAKLMEEPIRQAPDQWLMFHPVWGDVPAA